MWSFMLYNHFLPHLVLRNKENSLSIIINCMEKQVHTWLWNPICILNSSLGLHGYNLMRMILFRELLLTDGLHIFLRVDFS